MNISGGLNYLSSILKLNQPYKPEDIYTKNPLIKDKNELINNIKYIYSDISRSSETIEYIYSNNFQLLNNINDKENVLNNWTKSEILYKFGINSPLYKQSTLLYNNLLSNISNNGKDVNIKNNEDIEMKIEGEDLKPEEIKEKKTNVNSLCDELDNALKEYKTTKKEKEDRKKRMNEENRMDIVDINENKEKGKNENKKKILIDGYEVILENEEDCLKKITKYEEFF